MPAKLEMTPAQAATIRAMRAEGRTWDEIADRLLVSRDWVIRRGRELGLGGRNDNRTPSSPTSGRGRGGAPIPAGHPNSTLR